MKAAYYRLRIAWPLPLRLVKSAVGTLIVAALLTSLTATLIYAGAMLVAIAFISVARLIVLRQPDSEPLQGPEDRDERLAMLKAIAGEDITAGRSLNLTVMHEKTALAASVSNKRQIRMLLTQDIYDLPIAQFIGVALHEVYHHRPHHPGKLLRQIIGALLVVSLEVGLAATGLGFVAALTWATAMTLVEWPFLMRFFARRRREELACDRFAHIRGGDIVNGLRYIAKEVAAKTGGYDSPRRLAGLESLVDSHPAFLARLEALQDTPPGILDLHGYENIPDRIKTIIETFVQQPGVDLNRSEDRLALLRAVKDFDPGPQHRRGEMS